jgi:hypothetical protein
VTFINIRSHRRKFLNSDSVEQKKNYFIRKNDVQIVIFDSRLRNATFAFENAKEFRNRVSNNVFSKTAQFHISGNSKKILSTIILLFY